MAHCISIDRLFFSVGGTETTPKTWNVVAALDGGKIRVALATGIKDEEDAKEMQDNLFKHVASMATVIRQLDFNKKA